MYIILHHILPGACGGQKRVLGPQGLELQTVVSCRVGAVYQTRALSYAYCFHPYLITNPQTVIGPFAFLKSVPKPCALHSKAGYARFFAQMLTDTSGCFSSVGVSRQMWEEIDGPDSNGSWSL